MSSRTVPIDLMRATIAFFQLNGLDVDELLHAAGVPPRLIVEKRSRVTEEQVARFIRELWRHTDDELFGLGPHPLPRGSFRLLGYGLIGGRDLGEILHRFQGLSRATPAIPSVSVSNEGGAARIVFEQGLRHPLYDPVTPKAVETLVVCTAIAVAHRLMAWAVGGRLALTAVELPYEPRYEETHALVFGAPLVFGAAAPAIVFPAARLNAPTMRTEAEFDDLIARAPAGLLTRPAQVSTVAEEVRRIIEHAVRAPGRTRIPTGSDIAARLAVSQQTLRRRLASENTSLRRIRQDLLRDEAITSLARGDQPIWQLAQQLGFSETSTFTRAFTGWTGSPPSAYRAGDPHME